MGSLLRVSEAATIGLHAACLLSHAADAVRTARELAATLDVSETHLSKVMNRLQKAGLVRSILGPGGGFGLARGADRITLYEVLQAIDGPTGDAACLFNPTRCDGKGCLIGAISAEVNELVARRMGALTLAEVVSDSADLAKLAIKLARPTADDTSGRSGKAKHRSGR